MKLRGILGAGLLTAALAGTLLATAVQGEGPPTPEEYVAHVGGDARIVPAGELSLATIAAAFVTGPASLLPAAHAPRGIRVGAPADLVAVAAAASWTPNRDTLAGRSLNTPLIGRTLPGVVRLTLVNGVVAWEAPGD